MLWSILYRLNRARYVAKRRRNFITISRMFGAPHVTHVHRTTASSAQDLTDYLSQLLGRNDEEVQSFVDDVGRFQRGEPLSAPTGDVDGDAKPAAAVPTERTYDAKPTTIDKRPKEEPAHKIFGHSATKPATAAAPAKKVAASAAKAPAPSSSTASAKGNNIANAAPKTAPPPATAPKEVPTSANEKPPPKSHPPKGKASVVCGCFGSLHKPLTNCLYCGRVSCEREGYDFCPFCGMLVEQVSGGGKGYVQQHMVDITFWFSVVLTLFLLQRQQGMGAQGTFAKIRSGLCSAHCSTG